MKLDVVVPIELSSSALGGSKGKGRWHGAAVKQQREDVSLALRTEWGRVWTKQMGWPESDAGTASMGMYADDGARITLLRPYASSPLDDDNLASVFKAVRDGVADFLGVDDGSPRLFFRYVQCKARSIGKKLSKPKRKKKLADGGTTYGVPPKAPKLVPAYDTHIRIRIEIVPASDVDPMATAVRVLRAALIESALDFNSDGAPCWCAYFMEPHAEHCREKRSALATADALATFDPLELYNV